MSLQFPPARILAQLDGDATIFELFRAKHGAPIQAHEWNAAVKDIGPEWHIWSVRAMNDHECISRRPVLRTPQYIQAQSRTRITPTPPEIAALRERMGDEYRSNIT